MRCGRVDAVPGIAVLLCVVLVVFIIVLGVFIVASECCHHGREGCVLIHC
jgi:hypothetical protein